MSIKYCNLLLLRGQSAGVVALDWLVGYRQKVTQQSTTEGVKSLHSLNIMGFIPYLTTDFLFKQRQEKYIRVQAVDVILSLGFKYKILPCQTNKPNCSSFSYNNNYVTLIQSDEINFGYISFISWIQIVEKFLTFEMVKAVLEKNSCFLAANDQIQSEFCEIVREASLERELGVIFIRESADSNWGNSDISSLEDSRLVQEIQIGKAFGGCTVFGNPHYDRGNALTETYTSCPENMEVAGNDLYINFTSTIYSGISQEDSKREGLYYGCNDHAPLGSVGWHILTALVIFGFAHPDNFLVNRRENVWIETDISTVKVNNAVKSRTDNKGISAALMGVFENAMWYIVLSSGADKPLLFYRNLMECETHCSAEASFGYFLIPQFVTMFIYGENILRKLLTIIKATTYLSVSQIKYPEPESLT
jgi:hypothetical protein